MLTTYTTYKDSGVEWIEEIPSHWEITKMKYGVNHLSEKGKPEKTDIKISPENVESDTGVCFNLYSEHESDGMRFQSGDILLNKLRLYLKKILYVEYDGFSLGEMIVLRTNNKLNNKYFYQLLFSQGLIDLLDSQSTGIKLPRVSPDVILNTEIVYPPLNEQQQIVSFLDTKTSLIDSLIEKTQQKIVLIKEKRTSLINEVVTKGLNSNVKMKDSGVEWIGEIPYHYKNGKLKHLCNENQSSLSNSTDPDYGLNYIEISDVNSEGVIGNSTPYIFSESPSRCRRIVQKGDVIVSTVRTYLKSIGLIEEEVEDLICSTGFSVLTPNIEINSKYLFYLLRTEWFISMVISKSEGVSYPSIQSEKLMNIDVVFCELSEQQQQIVEYLDKQTEEIDTLIQLEQKKIDTLKEYRQSLISEVVTGKLRVV